MRFFRVLLLLLSLLFTLSGRELFSRAFFNKTEEIVVIMRTVAHLYLLEKERVFYEDVSACEAELESILVRQKDFQKQLSRDTKRELINNAALIKKKILLLEKTYHEESGLLNSLVAGLALVEDGLCALNIEKRIGSTEKVIAGIDHASASYARFIYTGGKHITYRQMLILANCLCMLWRNSYTFRSEGRERVSSFFQRCAMLAEFYLSQQGGRRTKEKDSESVSEKKLEENKRSHLENFFKKFSDLPLGVRFVYISKVIHMICVLFAQRPGETDKKESTKHDGKNECESCQKRRSERDNISIRQNDQTGAITVTIPSPR